MLNPKNALGISEIFSVYYHDIFDYPLTELELIRWRVGKKIKGNGEEPRIKNINGFIVLKGRDGLIYQRKLKERASLRKVKYLSSLMRIFLKISTIKMVGISGSLAMNSASEDSDIDLMIITKESHLWFTRAVTLLVLALYRVPVRRVGKKEEMDRLCLNMWLDENKLLWQKKDRNFYTAHEIAQIVPLINKDHTYEKFIAKNKWILDFWPNSVKIKNLNLKLSNKTKASNFMLRAMNFIAYKIQRLYMRGKITREVVTPTRAIFHPNDLGKKVLLKLQQNFDF